MAGPEIQSAKQTIVCKDNSGYDYEESLFSNYHSSPKSKVTKQYDDTSMKPQIQNKTKRCPR